MTPGIYNLVTFTSPLGRNTHKPTLSCTCEGRLPAARLADDADALPTLDRQRDPVDRAHDIARVGTEAGREPTALEVDVDLEQLQQRGNIGPALGGSEVNQQHGLQNEVQDNDQSTGASE